MNPTAKMTYSKGFFTLKSDLWKLASKQAIPDIRKWELIGDDACRTKDFKAAARFWQYASDKAGKVLNRAIVKLYPAPSQPLPLFLDPHQVEGVDWILTRSRSYLAHAPGAGKTCEAVIASLWCEKPGTTLFIVPPNLTVNWAREIELWLERTEMAAFNFGGFAAVSIVPESKDQDYTGWRSDFIICPDSMLAKDWVLDGLALLKFKFVAVDEASRFKDSKAERTIALFGGKLKSGRKVPGLIYDAYHTVLLDGSPMPNRPMELWAPTFAMSPETIDYMDQTAFGFKYCGPKINNYGKWEFKFESNGAELRERLQRKFMHVVPEERLNHPERKRSMLYMSKDVRSLKHRNWEKQNLDSVNYDNISEETNQGELASFRQELGLRKVPWIVQYVHNRLESKNESILLFAWHREVVEQLHLNLYKYKPGLVYGGTTDAYREHVFAQFQSGAMKLLILNIASGGRGHNLQRADRVIFGEFSWTDELNKQAEKRASRKGNDKATVRCDYIVCPDSMDERILKSVFRKAESVKRIIG